MQKINFTFTTCENTIRFYSKNSNSLFFVSHMFSVKINKVIVFEEQEADYKVQFEDMPDLGMAADIQ